MIIFIPGAVVAVLTFPGVILHEMAHKFFCDLYRIPVYKVKYFAASKNAGYVLHENSGDSREKAIISLAPLLVNSIVCFFLLLPEVLLIITPTSFVSKFTFLDIFLIWVGLSCLFNAIPSKADIAHIDNNVSWPFILLKRVVQACNFVGFAGSFLWVMILIISGMLSVLLILQILMLVLKGLALLLSVFV